MMVFHLRKQPKEPWLKQQIFCSVFAKLAVQSANATNSGSDRAALQPEVAQLRLNATSTFLDQQLASLNFNNQK